jgi:hypothetical protein
MRKKLAVVVVVFLTVVTGVLNLTRPRPYRINWEGFCLITEGMTRQEVEDILGRSPGDYADRREDLLPWESEAFGTGRDTWCWIGDDGRIVVTFTEGGRAMEKEFFPVDESWTERPWTERVRRILRRSFRTSWPGVGAGP